MKNTIMKVITSIICLALLVCVSVTVFAQQENVDSSSSIDTSSVTTYENQDEQEPQTQQINSNETGQSATEQDQNTLIATDPIKEENGVGRNIYNPVSVAITVAIVGLVAYLVIKYTNKN